MLFIGGFDLEPSNYVVLFINIDDKILNKSFFFMVGIFRAGFILLLLLIHLDFITVTERYHILQNIPTQL